MRSSRRSRRLQKKTKKNILLTFFGIVVIFIFLIKLGIPLMANFALFISGFRTTDDTKLKESTFIQPPILDPIPFATNSAQIQITGRSIKDGEVKLYINDRLVDSTAVDDKGNFKFTPNISEGENIIKTKVKVDEKESAFSDPISVIYKNFAPSVTIDTPPDGESYKKDDKNVNVTGKTESGATVTVNGFWAIVDENNNYSYNLPLKNGENEIRVVATDQAGNTSEKIIKVSYSE